MQQKTAPGSSVTSYTRDQVKPLEELGSGVRAHVELAFSPGPQRGRIIIGWLYDPGANKTRLAALGAGRFPVRAREGMAGGAVGAPLGR